MRYIGCLITAACVLNFNPTSFADGPAPSLSYAELVSRLTDMEHLAVLAPAGERGAQASSYDRASRYDAEHDKYLGWGANADGSGVVRHEGKESVLAEITGPGCIWRTWSPAAKAGHVKIYFDGEAAPTVDLPFTQYFDRSSEPFTREQLVYVTPATGGNNYTPMPFQKSCKIVGDEGWGAYFHFTYTQFEKGTQVPTFSRNLSPQDSRALDRANQILADCGKDPAGKREGQKTETKSLQLEPGKLTDAIALEGAGAITGLRIKVPLASQAEAQRTLLAQLTIQIHWDDDNEPAVWAPLGDFFASPAGAVPFRSLPVGLLKDGTFYCCWYMPFASRARISLGNDGPDSVPVDLEVTHAPLNVPVAALAHFHAKWHRDAFLPERADRSPDWTMLKTSGRGRYVGVSLHVWNPRGGWWGEGDEKFFVDGEKFPSTFGTGSEDFFGYGWGNPTLFVKPFHGQPVNENNAGHVAVNRWEIAEDIPFDTSFEGCIEKYFSNFRPTLYAATVFWYLAPGGDDPYGTAPVGERVGCWIRPQIYREKDVLEAESMAIAPKPEDAARPQPMVDNPVDHWSNDAQLLWRCTRIGRELTLKFPVNKAGKYRVKARLTKAPDFGVFQIAADGKQLGGEMDLYGATVTATPLTDLGEMEFSEGDHQLTIKATGKNNASHGLFFGLDFIKLEPAAEK